MPTSPLTPHLRTRLHSLLGATSSALGLWLASLFVVGCLSNPTPHPGIDDDSDPTTGFENDGEVRGGGDDHGPDGGTPPGETDALADVCGPPGGDAYGDVSRDACGAGEVSDPGPPDVCGPGSADVHGDTGVDASCAPDITPAAGEFDDDDVGPTPSAEAP